MADAIRSFLAVPVGKSVADPLMATVNASTHALPPLRVTPWANLHLTLVFLGAIPRSVLDEQVIPRVGELLAGGRPGRIHFRQVAGFPDPGSPRHLVLEGYASPTIETLQRTLREGLAETLGHARQEQQWRPHITVAHFRDRKPRPITATPWQAELPVAEVCLYESEQGLHGPVYRVRERWPLAQEPDEADATET
ncbi:RNA 2',3'-cyclic phosphodiesterase [Vreelandella utahensis]|uniref:RNA 2',3'-cyclic phosphodiesterase n=1 Tax=Vreelandella halophila TaxID=86177 RepID=UPI002481C9FF|nr:RNA 2',3'-cyclic phosphodiesterase [Halomonas utahensis]